MSNHQQHQPLQNRWSPITCLPQQAITPSGLLSLDHDDGEVELISRSPIELRSTSSNPRDHTGLRLPFHLQQEPQQPKWNDRDENLTVTITTHRIVFQTKRPIAFQNDTSIPIYTHFLHLSNVEEPPTPSGGNWTTNRSYKIELTTLSHGSLSFTFRNPSTSHAKTDRDTLHQNITRAYGRRQWEESARLDFKREHSGVNSTTKRLVGVDAIMAKNRARNERAKQIAEDAFGGDNGKVSTKEKQEVETLLREAGELVGVIHKYVATLEKQQAQKGGNDGDDGNSEDTKQLTSMLQNMGMITALSSHQVNSKSEYHDRLARQISDFLQISTSKFKKAGGIMTLTDVYCLFNRARGTNMISPEELLDAVKLVEVLGLGLKLREFDESGVVVIQEAGFDDSVMAEKIIEYIDGAEEEEKEKMSDDDGGNSNTYVGVTALDAGRILKISALLANEILLGAEREGVLCRDVTISAQRFYRNMFVSSHFITGSRSR